MGSIDSHITLTILSGPEPGKTFRDIETPISIGRTEGCTIQIDDGYLARRHTHILFKEGQLVIEDLDSPSGTRVNGRLCNSQGLNWGDIISVGRTVLLVNPQYLEAAIQIFEDLVERNSEGWTGQVYKKGLIEVLGAKGEFEKIRAVVARLKKDFLKTQQSQRTEWATYLDELADLLLKVQAYREAEELLQEYLILGEALGASKYPPDNWDSFPNKPLATGLLKTRFRLGWALLGLGRISEAETLLHPSYEALDENSLTKNFKRDRLRDTIQFGLLDIARVYRSYDQPTKADKLQVKLDRLLEAWGGEELKHD